MLIKIRPNQANMRIKNVLIKNFKSIKKLNIPFIDYGSGSQTSKTTFLVGINESGKSAILEALSLIKKGFDHIDYSTYCSIDAQGNTEYIDLYTEFELVNSPYWQKKLESKLNLSPEFASEIEFLSVKKNTYLKEDKSDENFEIKIADNLPFYKLIYVTHEKTVNGQVQKSYTIESLKEFNKIEEEITQENAKSFLKENQKLLTKGRLEDEIAEELNSILNVNIPTIQIWKSSPEYLINEIIDLEKFKDDTNISIPLKNIFHIYGKKNDKEIKSAIEKALGDQARCDELQDKMSAKVTRHINNIWKEHKVKLKISINSKNCQVQVVDKDKKFNYYTMEQRSDGFKQFVSLILSLSAQNDSNNLNNKVILIDEPEVHLHPSGIKYMRDEILKIGKNNYVFVATHSQDMIDVSTPERHWIVEKKKSETSILQIDHNSSVEDDKVLASAFGINLFKELLPRNIIIVEGGDDKAIISHCIKKLNEKFFYSIKSSGGASKVPGFARLLGDEKIDAFIVFDADKDGRDNKKKILDNQKENYSTNNVFTIKDLCQDLPNDSTVEDLLPLSFVKNFFDEEMEQEFNLESNKAVLIQIKNQCHKLKTDKQKLESLKIKLSESFIEKFITKTQIQKINRIKLFIESLLSKIECEA